MWNAAGVRNCRLSRAPDPSPFTHMPNAMRPLPKHVILFGDLAFDHGRECDYKAAKEVLQPLYDAGIKIVHGMGNHDRRLNFAKYFPEAAAQTVVPGRIVTVVSLAHCDFIMLDSLKGDNDDHIPYFHWGLHRITGGTNEAKNEAKPWHQAAYDYIGDIKPFQCPGNQKKTGSVYGWYIDNWNANQGSGSNVYPNYGYSESGQNESWVLSIIKRPSESLEFADCRYGLIGHTGTDWAAGAGLTPQGYFYRILASMEGSSPAEAAYEGSCAHGGSVNLGFYDGHVEFRNWRSVRKVGYGGNLRYNKDEVSAN